MDIRKELAYYESIQSEIAPLITDTVSYAHESINGGKRILVEGANAAMLDIDFGTYPYVTSSNPSIGSVCSGLGIPPAKIGSVTGIAKAYCTRVGEGPFPTELLCDQGDSLRKDGHEYGTTTGRPRRCGWIDIPQLRYAAMVNGFTDLNLTKVDVFTGYETVKIGLMYRDSKTGKVVENRMPASLKV